MVHVKSQIHTISGAVRAATLLSCSSIFLLFFLGAAPCQADQSSKGSGFEVAGEILKQGMNVSAGGSFQIVGRKVELTSGPEGREFTLSSIATKAHMSSSGCPCQAIFSDGFESGNFSAWSSSVGGTKKTTLRTKLGEI